MEIRFRDYMSNIVLAELISYRMNKKHINSHIEKLEDGNYKATIDYNCFICSAVSSLDLYAMEVASFKLIQHLIKEGVVKDLGLYCKDWHNRLHIGFCEELMDALIKCGYIKDVKYIQKYENDKWNTELSTVHSFKLNLGDELDCLESYKDKDISKKLCINKYLFHLCVWLNQYYIHKEDDFTSWFYSQNELPQIGKEDKNNE